MVVLGGAVGAAPGLTWGLLPLGSALHPRVKRNSESERRSPSSEDDRDERESRAEIQNAEDYSEIFQPKNSISEATVLAEGRPGPSQGQPCCGLSPLSSSLAPSLSALVLQALWAGLPWDRGQEPGPGPPQQRPSSLLVPQPCPERRETHRSKWAGAPGVRNRVPFAWSPCFTSAF